jgi:serine/threonine protein kinase
LIVLWSLQRLGQGHYGEVWEACWTNRETRKRIRVAMKTPKDSRIMTKKEFDSQIYSIRKEIEVLTYVGKHEYVLQLIGAVTNNPENIRMVTEFCEFGSLQDFLKDKKLRGLFMDEIVSKQYENHSTDSAPTTIFIVSFVYQRPCYHYNFSVVGSYENLKNKILY